MAGPFTHWMVVEAMLGPNAIPIANPYFDYLKQYKPYVLLGAVGPDYPYMSQNSFEGISWEDLIRGRLRFLTFSWADKMHYDETDDMIRLGLKNLATQIGSGSVSKDIKITLAWLFGYAAHVVTDCVIHPVVNQVVGGPYSEENKNIHRHTEIVQDVYSYRKIQGGELRDSRYQDQLIQCSEPGTGDLKAAVRELWLDIIQNNYRPEFDSTGAEPNGWHLGYMLLLPMSSHNIISRHSVLGILQTVLGSTLSSALGLNQLAYITTGELTQPDNLRCIANILRPGVNPTGQRIDFDEAFDRTTVKLREIWENMIKDLAGLIANPGITVGQYLQSWNIDTGIPVGSNEITFWV